MTVPGQNNLLLALQVLGPQTIQLFRFLGETDSPSGKPIKTFAPAETFARCSVQPVPATSYDLLGLNRAKRYVQVWAPADVYGVARDHSPDEFEWNGSRYEVTQDTGWFPQDGWCQFLGILKDANARH